MTTKKQTGSKLPEVKAVEEKTPEMMSTGEVVGESIVNDKAEKLNTATTEDAVVLEVEAVPTIWTVIDNLSDDEMTVEAANIQAPGRSHMLMRFRIGGQLTGLVQTVERMHFNKSKQAFIPR